MKEKISHLDIYKKETFESLTKAIEDKVSFFLDVNGISNVRVIWDTESDLFTLSFSLYETDTNEALFGGGTLQADLVRYLQNETIPELAGYTINPYLQRGYIGFIKE